MKKELKRYALAEYEGYLTREYKTKEEYEELIKKVNKYNSSNKKNVLFGNISYTIDKNNIYHVIINKYNLLTKKMTISDLDNLTIKYENASELKRDFKSKLKTEKPSIKIIYLEDKNKNQKTYNDVDRGIRSIDILYKEDLKYMSYKYLELCIKYYIDNNDYGFFLDMSNEFESNKYILELIEELRACINDSRNKRIHLSNTNILNIVYRLYSSHILERNKDGIVLRDDNGKEIISRRRLRDFGFFVRNYRITERKRYQQYAKYYEVNHIENNSLDSRIEQEEDLKDEESALDAWDKGIIYKRK